MSGHDEARDPHLREALRHAPDAQVQAPAAVADFILKEARAKARDPKPAADTTAPGWALRLWDWLARPAVATSFAGVMAATLVGLMWWDQPMDEAQPRSPMPAAAPMPQKAAPAPASTPVVTVDGLSGAKPPPEVPRQTAAGGTAGVATAPAAKPAPARSEAKSLPPQEARPVESDTRDATVDRSAGASAEVATPPPAPPAPAAPVVAAPPAKAFAPPPTPAAAPPTVAADAAAGALLAKSKAKEDLQKRERSSVAPEESLSRRAVAQGQAQLNESRMQLEAEAYTRVASVRAAIASEPARWAWQRLGGSPQAMNDAVYAWLAQLDQEAGTRWQARGARETAAPRGRGLLLLRDGQVQHSLQVTERGILWQRGQTAWQLELPADQLVVLQAALDRAAP